MQLRKRHSEGSGTHYHTKLAVSPAIELLESRKYMTFPSAGVNVVGHIPASVTAGAVVNEKFAVAINSFPQAVSGAATIDLFASPDGSFRNPDDVQIATKDIQVNLAAHASHTFFVNVPSFPANLSGDFQIIANVNSFDFIVGVQNGSKTKIHIGNPDLAGSIFKTPATAKVGRKLPVTIEVSNIGDVVAKGSLAIALSISAASDGSSPLLLGTLSRNVQIQPDKSQKLRLSVSLPKGTPAGTYYVVAAVDSTNTFIELDVANNTAVGLTPVVIG